MIIHESLPQWLAIGCQKLEPPRESLGMSDTPASHNQTLGPGSLDADGKTVRPFTVNAGIKMET